MNMFYYNTIYKLLFKVLLLIIIIINKYKCDNNNKYDTYTI